MTVKKCVVCGGRFITRSSKKTCTVECRMEDSRESDRSRRAANPEKAREINIKRNQKRSLALSVLRQMESTNAN